MKYQIMNKQPDLAEAAKVVAQAMPGLEPDGVVADTAAHINGNFIQSIHSNSGLVGFANYEVTECFWR
ncbi:MAG: hypothetical protein AAF413_01000 [Patescibacteria group bacterium]